MTLVVIYDVSAAPYYPNENDVVFKLNKYKNYNLGNVSFKSEKMDAAELLIQTRKLMTFAKETNNPLVFGKVEALLINNKNTVETNDKLKTVYADVLQKRHAFSDAIHKIKNINTSEANLLRATIYVNLGEYKKASAECKKLLGNIDLLVASTCLLHTDSYQGNLLQSFIALKKISYRFKENKQINSAWTLTALADMSSRLGDADSSIKYYQEAVENNPTNAHVLSEMVDVLYKNNQQDKIIKTLENNHSDIRLSLRYFRSMILQDKLKDSHLSELVKLKESVSLLELRKDQRHYDTRAEYYIWIEANPEKALFWAEKNWQVSQTPTSATLLIQAVKSNKNIFLQKHSKLTKEVYRWIKENNVEDESLMRIIKNMIAKEIVV